MDFFEIVDVILLVLMVASYVLTLFFRVKSDVIGSVSELIALAESTGLTGRDKMGQVVDALYERVPQVLKRILSKDRLQSMAQWIFDWMRRYADTYAASKAADENEPAALDEEHVQSVAEIIAGLTSLTRAQLCDKAKECGAEISDGQTKDDIVRAIVYTILTQV